MKPGEKFILGVCAFIMLYMVVGAVIYISKGEHECIATVTDKDRNESGDYLIFCEDLDGNTVVLDIAGGKYNSSDIYKKIEKNKTYNFHVRGRRTKLWNVHEIIVSFEEYDVYQDDKKEVEQKQSEVVNKNKEIGIKIIPEVTEQTAIPYFVSIEFNSKEGISIKKLYKPEISNELDLADETIIRDTIIANGIDIFGTSFEVSENGVYWLYIQEISGTEYIQRFIIENIN